MASTTETPAAPAAAAEPQKASEPTPAPAPATAPAPAPAPVAAASSAAPQNGHSEPARDRSPRRSRSPSRERERERERSRSASRDRSPRRERSVDRKASRSPSRRSRSRSPRRDRSPSRDKKSRDRSRSRSRSPRRSSERDHRGSSSSRSRYDDDRYRSDRRERDRRDDRDDRRYDDRRRDDRDDRRRSPPRSSASSVAAAAPARAAGPVPPAAAQSFGVVSGAFPYAAPVGYGNPYGAPQGGYGGGYGAASSSSSSARGPVAKNFYKPPASHANFTDDQVREWWRENRITLQGRGAELFKPCRTFDESNLAAEYLITTRTFPKPTPIQAQTWPVALSGRDMIGIAETGSGKTLAFVVPGCVHIRAQPPLSPAMPGPIVLILAPTRELACQTQEVCDAVGRGLGIRTVCLYGGVGKGSQRGALQRGVHIAVATPGRLLDLINEGRCNISRVTYLVLDEADRMLDMGFEKDIRAIIERLRPDRQTVMFSATWPVEIQRLAHEFLQDPIKVTIGSPDLAANRRITQVVEVLQSPDDRDDRLDACLRKYHASGQNRILIFVGMKREADRVDRMLRNRYRWRSQAIHGDLDQNERTRVLAQFKSGTAPLLVATDVAARGLDIPDVEYVINYTFPMNIEDYVHRIGRTGRGGKEGLAHTFLVPQDAGKARDLIDILRKANQQVPPELEDMSAYGRRGGGGRGGGGRGGGGGYGGGGGGGGGGRWPSGGGGGGGGGHSSAHGGYGSQGGYRGPAAPAAPVAAAAPAAYGAPAAMPWAAYGQYAAYAPAAYAMPYGMPYGMPTSGGPGAPTAHK